MRMALLCLVLVACGSGGSPRRASMPEPLAGAWQPPAILAHVPADTPYLFASLDAIPQVWRDRMYATLDDKLRALTKELEPLRGADRTALDPWMRALLAVLDELRGKDVTRWATELGFDRNGRFLVYGLSVWPVLRVTLSDPDRLRRIAAKALAAGGWPVVEQKLDGHAYWRFEHMKASVFVGVIGDELVASVFPTQVAAAMIPLLVGSAKPTSTLRDAPTIGTLFTRYGLRPPWIGLVDIRAIANIVTGRTSSAEKVLDKPITDAAGPIAPECRVELDRLVELAPRAVMGYRRLDPREMHFRMVLEAPVVVTAALARLRTAMPEVTSGFSGHPLAAMGVAVNVDEAIPLLQHVAQSVSDAPFRCSWFSPLDDAARDLAATLAKPLPPMLRGVRGVSLVVDEYAKEPLALEAHAVVEGAHVRDLVTLLGVFVPAMSMVQVPPDGTPVAVPLSSLPMLAGMTAHVAASAERLSVAVGTATDTRTAELMARSAPKRSPLLSISMDVPRLVELGALDEDKRSQLSDIRDIVMQLDVSRDGIVADVYATFPP